MVILDINMPVLDGYAAARRFRATQRSPRVVLVALTARSSLTDLEAAEAAGFDIHLTKPVDGGQLVGVVEHALQERH
ncbi:MAG: response regulator [Methylibium sp.]|nr:response regulator [Methylibium sp.]